MINLDENQGGTGLLPRLPGLGPSWPNLGQDEPLNVQQEYMAQRRALESDRLSKLYLDEKEFARLANQPEIREGRRLSLLGEDLPKVALNAAYLSHRLGRKVTAAEYELARDSYAAANFGQEAVTDGQFFDLVKGEYDVRRQKTEALDELRLRMAAQSLEDGVAGADTPAVDTWKAWKEKHRDLVGDEEDLPYLAAAVGQRNEFKQVVDKYKHLAAPGLDLLKKFTAGEASGEELSDFARTLAAVPQEEQDMVIDLIALGADGGQIDRGALKEFATSLGQTFSRGFNFIPQSMLQQKEVGVTAMLDAVESGTKVWVLPDGDLSRAVVSNTEPDTGYEIKSGWREATAEERQKMIDGGKESLAVFRLERQLRAVADNNVDPIKRIYKGGVMGAAEGGVLGVVGSLPILSVNLISPVAATVAYQSLEYDRMKNENPDMDVRAAYEIAGVEGAWQALIDRLQIRTMQGRGLLPSTGRLLGKIKSTGLRRTVGFGARGFEQFGQELAQDIGTMGIDALASSLREDMKDKNFAFELGEYWKQAPEVLVASLLFGLIGGKAVSTRDIKVNQAELDEQARIVGISEDGRKRMRAATTPEELDAVVERELKAVTPEAQAAGALYAKARRQAVEAAQADPNEPTLEVVKDEEGNSLYRITTPDGETLIETRDAQAAQAAFLDYRTASETNEVQALKDVISYWQNRDPELSIEQAPAVLVKEELDRLEGIGDAAGIERLRQRLVAADIDPDGDLTGVQIFGSTTVQEVGENVYRGTILVRQGAAPETVLEEVNHAFVRRALMRGDVTLDTLSGWLDQTAAATGLDIKRGNEVEIIESIAQVGMDLFNGRLDQAQLPQSLVDYLRRLMRVVKEIYLRAVKVTEAFDRGEIDGNFEQFLMQSMGMDPQQQIDINSTTTAAAVAAGVSPEDFSVGRGGQAMPDVDLSVGRARQFPTSASYLDEIDRILDLPDKPESVETSPFEGGKVRTIAKLFQRMIGAQARIEFGSLDEPGAQEKIEQAGDRIFEVLRRAAYEFPNFASWYESRLKMALDIFEQLDPDVAKEDNRAALLVVLAITSNGADVRTQTFDGWDVYRHWKRTGKLAGAPEKSGALRGKATENKLLAADKMAAALGGYAQLGQFLNRKGTVGELRKAMAEELGGTFTKDQINKLTNGELVSEVVPFSLVFGPKLGSFYNNMSGDFSTVTMDRWFMRTFGRAMGTQLAAVSRQTLADKDKRLREAIKPYKGDLLQRAGIRKGTGDPRKIAVALGKFFQKEENRSKLTEQEDEIRKAANDLFKVADGLALIEAPSTGTHRRWIRAVMSNALEKYNAQTDKPLVPAEAQALLWYYEKLVHETYGSRQKDSSPDYASSANQLYLREKGVRSDRFRDSDGIERRPGGGRSAAFGSLRAGGPQGVEDFSLGRARVTFAQQLKELQAGESNPVDTSKTFWLIADSSGDIVDILDNEQDAETYFRTTASTGEWLWEYKDGLRTKVPLLKRGVAERRAEGYIDTVRYEQERREAGLDATSSGVFYGADTSPETATSAGEIPSYTPDGQLWTGQEESVVYHGGRLFDPQGTDPGGYGETQTLKPRRPDQTYLFSVGRPRVDRALASAMNRKPGERLAMYERAKEMFDRVAERRGEATGADGYARTLQSLWELDAILKVLPAEVRGKVGGFTRIAELEPVDLYRGDELVKESNNPAGARISAWMQEGLDIGQAGKQTGLPEGYSIRRNTDPARATKATDDFLVKRLATVGKQLDRYLANEYRIAIERTLEAARPKRSESGVRKSTLGPEAQAYADKALAASNLDNDQTAQRLAAIEAELLDSNTTDERKVDLVEEWGLINTFGDIESRNAETLAQGLAELKTRLKAGRDNWRMQQEARITEQRGMVAAIITGLGEPGKVKRFAAKGQVAKLGELLTAAGLDHRNFEQFLRGLGLDETIVTRWSEALRKSDTGSQDMELAMREELLEAVKTAGRAGNMGRSRAMVFLKQPSAKKVRAMDGRKVTDERISIELAQKIVRGTADRSKLSDADVATLREELAALPADTRKKFVTIKRVISAGNPVAITLTPAQAIQLELSWDQPDVQEKMRREGWTDESIEDIRAITSEPVAAATLAFLRDFYARNYAMVNPVYARMFGMNMPQAKFYAPSRFLSAGAEKEISLDGSPAVSGSTPGFAKARVSHSAPLAPEDALTVFQQHVAQSAHWINFAELAREARAVTNNLEVREALRQRYGDSAVNSLNKWVEMLEQRGGNKSREIAWLTKAFGSVLSGTAISSLGFNLKTVFIQLDSAMRFMLAMDPRQIGQALMDPAALAASMPKIWFSPSIQRRLKGGMNPAVQLLFARDSVKPGPLSNLAWLSMQPIQIFDAAATTLSSAMVFRSRFVEAKESGLTDADAEAAALDAVDAAIYRYSQPTGFGSKSVIENTGNVFAKVWMLFLSDPRLKTGVLIDAVSEIGKGKNLALNLQRIVAIEAMAIVSHVIASAYRDAFSDEEDEEIWDLGGFVQAMALAPLQGLFVAGTMSELALRALFKEQLFTRNRDPFVSTAESLVRGVSSWERLLFPEDAADGLKAWNTALRGIAFSTPLGAPAALLNILKPFIGLQQNLEADE